MKKPTDNIFRLIQAMSPAEKRYFKRHYASDQSAITALFDFVNGLNQYDEEAVKTHFGKNVAKNLKVYKIQLYDLILKSLVSYHQKNNVLSKIRTGLEEVDVLIEKQLYKQAGLRLSKLKKLALKFEEFTYLIEIAQKEFHLFHLHHDRIGISQHPVFNEIQETISQLKKHFAVIQIGHQLQDSIRSRTSEILLEDEKAEIKNLLQIDLLTIKADQLPFRSQLSRNALLSFLYKMLNNQEAEFKARKSNVDLFHQFPHFKDSMPFNYIGVLRNYLNFCGKAKMEKEVYEIIAEAVSFVEKHKKMEIHLIHFYYVELILSFKAQRFDHILEQLEPKINGHFKKHGLKEERIVGLIYQILIVTYLIKEDHSMVQNYFRKVEEVKSKLNNNVVAFLQILELVSHSDSNDEFLISRLISSWQRRKKSESEALPGTAFYQDCLEFFKNLSKNPFNKIELTKTFLAQLSQYQESHDRVYLTFMEHYLDQWLKAVTTKRSFAAVMRENKEKLLKKDARQFMPGTSRLV